MSDFLDRNVDFFLGGATGLLINIFIFTFAYITKNVLYGYAMIVTYLI